MKEDRGKLLYVENTKQLSDIKIYRIFYIILGSLFFSLGIFLLWYLYMNITKSSWGNYIISFLFIIGSPFFILVAFRFNNMTIYENGIVLPTKYSFIEILKGEEIFIKYTEIEKIYFSPIKVKLLKFPKSHKEEKVEKARELYANQYIALKFVSGEIKFISKDYISDLQTFKNLLKDKVGVE